jgi:hypothetical protein
LVLPNEIRPTPPALHLVIKALRYLLHLLLPSHPARVPSSALIPEASLILNPLRGNELYPHRRCSCLLRLIFYTRRHALLDRLVCVPLPRCLLLLFLHAHQVLLEMRLVEPGRRRLLRLRGHQVFKGGGRLKVLHGQGIDGLTEQVVDAVLQEDREAVIPEVTHAEVRRCLDVWCHQQVHEEGPSLEAEEVPRQVD